MPPTHYEKFKYSGEVYPEWNEEYVNLQVQGMRWIMVAAFIGISLTYNLAKTGFTQDLLVGLAVWMLILGLRCNYVFGRRRWLRYASRLVANAEPVRVKLEFQGSNAVIKDGSETKIKLDEPSKRVMQTNAHKGKILDALAYRSPETGEWIAVESPDGLWRLAAKNALRQCVLGSMKVVPAMVATAGTAGTAGIDACRRLSQPKLAD